MDYGDIIKRSWRITWRYRALWALGLFAGISGCQAGGGGNSGGSNGNLSDLTSGSGTGSGGMPEFGNLVEQASRLLPLIVGVSVLFFTLWLLWSILSVAAQGALVTGVNGVEEGSVYRLRQLWGVGFAKFWRLIGLDVLLKLPIFAVTLLILVLIFVPILGAVMNGQDPSPEMLVPMCGSLALGIPVLLVMSFVFGIMHLIALRYVMLGGQGAIEAAGNSWKFLRARFKDTFLMYLVNAGLNLAASFAIAIPVVIVVLVLIFPTIAAGVAESWGALAGLIVVMLIALWIVGGLYTAIWGTFTSSLWTIFFRMATGMEPPKEVVAPAPVPTYAPQPPLPPEPTIAPYAPESPLAPEPPAEPVDD